MKPTLEQLNESWDSFLKVGNSYNIERPYKAYQVLYDDIVNNGDDSEDCVNIAVEQFNKLKEVK